MWIVTKQNENVRELSPYERELVLGYTRGNLTGQAYEQAGRILRGIRRDQHWLACDCSSPVPLMNLALLDSGTLALKNNRSSPAHLDSCPFIKQESPDENDISQRRHKETRIAPDSHLALHSEFSGETKGAGQQISRSGAVETGKSQKRLLSLLMSISESAAIHEFIPGKERTITEGFQRLREALWRYQLLPGVPMQPYSDSRLDKRRLFMLASKLRESKAFGVRRKYGVLLDVVPGIAGRKIKLTPETELSFFGHVERWSSASGPYLILSTVAAEHKGTQFYELAHVAVIPVLSNKCYLPVAFDEERPLLNEVLSILNWLWTKHKIQVTLRRNIFSDLRNIELIGKGKMLVLDLDSTLREANEIQPSSLSLADVEGDVDHFKKRIARYFLGDK